MDRRVAVGQSILLIDSKSGNEIVCHVRSVIRDESAVNLIDIEFSEESPKFWLIEFPSQEGDATEQESLTSSPPPSESSSEPLPEHLGHSPVDGDPDATPVTPSEPIEIQEDPEETAGAPAAPNLRPLALPSPSRTTRAPTTR